MTLLSGDEIAAMAGMDDWRSVYDCLEGRFDTGDFTTGLSFVNRIGAAAEEINHHPDVTLTYGAVHVVLTSHDAGGKTQRDVDLARRISDIAAELGVEATPSTVQRIELALDTWDRGEVMPFWAAVLGMEPGDDDVIDPNGVAPSIWFQDAAPDTAQRWHLDVRVPPEEAERRIAAAVEAGGTIVSEERSPRFVVLADPQGNQICVCTHLTRDR